MADTAMMRRDVTELAAELAEKVLVGGDLERLSPAERLSYIETVCRSLGLNPTTRPFEYVRLQGKLTLYARKDAAEQLRRRYGVSVYRLEETTLGDLHIVTAYARMPDGREDIDKGAVNISGKRGDDLVNALLKAVTKAKRRVTLSICGLGFLDETELDTIPQVQRQPVNPDTGEIEGEAREIPADQPKLSPDLRKARKAFKDAAELYGYPTQEARLDWVAGKVDHRNFDSLTIADWDRLRKQVQDEFEVAGKRTWTADTPAMNAALPPAADAEEGEEI